jgi:cytochrome c-type biogenesis protein CcmI
MTLYYYIAVALLLLGCVGWLWAVRLKPSVDEEEQQALAREQLSTYRLRLKELDFEKGHELLDEREFNDSTNELKRQLLHDLRGQQQGDSNKKLPLFLPGSLFLLVFVAAFYYGNGESSKLHDWHMANEQLAELGPRALLNKGEALSAKEMRQLALGLRTKLHHSKVSGKPDDPNAWVLLGEVTMGLNDAESALLAFEQAYKLAPNKPSIALGYAQMLLMLGDQGSIAKSALLLSKVLKQQPTNVNALLMIAYIAEQRGDLDKAKMSWQLLQARLPEDDPRRAFVTQKLNQTGSATQATTTAKHASSANAKVSVKLSLAAALQDKLPSNGTLFVYAKAAKGRPLPAAVVKLSEFNFPLTVELSDANAMLQDYTLSTLEDVVIWGRVSVDGDIGITAGEMQGQSEVFKVKDTQSVAVVIDQLL